ncbi:MAG: ankyrin repeat domain-containing protein, partial [Candidatus Hydrogenedentales bacterium]
ALREYPGPVDDTAGTPIPPAHLAAKLGAVESLEVLVKEMGAGTSQTDGEGLLPLHHAAEAGHARVIEWLAANDADVNARSELTELTPLHFAAANGHTDAAQALLDAGAYPAALDARGWTPGNCAAERGNEAMVALLNAATQPSQTAQAASTKTSGE